MLLPSNWRRSRDDQRVRLHIPGLGAVDARVDRAVTGAAQLTLLAKPPIPTRFLNNSGVMLESLPATSDEIARTWGRLSAIPDRNGRVRRDRVWFFKTAPPKPKPVQRRKHMRASAQLPVTFVPERFEVAWLEGVTRDISVGGVLLAGADPIGVGERVRLVLELPSDDHLIDTFGEVVRELKGGLRAMRIPDLRHGDRDRIAHFVAEVERLAIVQQRARERTFGRRRGLRSV